jgi:predicted anti-sigma-YlaC factor YlaD
MADRAWVWITLGVVTLVGVWFVGDTRRAGQARAAAQPILENRWVSYAIAAGSVLVLALIAPLFARGWVTSLAILALAIVGIEVVRNIVQREAQQTTSS